MIKGFLNLPWFAWAGFALIVAIIYSIVWPSKAVRLTNGFRYLVLRWGHALVWILLTINFILRGLSPSFNDSANLIAAVGGLVNLLFMVMTFIIK